MRRPRRAALLAVSGAALLVAFVAGGAGAKDNGEHDGIAKRAAEGELRPAQIQVTQNGQTVTKTLPFLSAAAVAAAKQALAPEAGDMRVEGADAGSGADLGAPNIGANPGTLGCSQRAREHGDNSGRDRSDDRKNVRVNQDCTFRRQAEEEIAFNPANPDNLIAGQNDSRVGFNQCGIDFSFDNGQHWGDMIPPFRQKVNNPLREEPTASDPNRHTIAGGPGTLHTYDAGSDPTVAFDTQGRGFFSCLGFDVFTDASLVYVMQSPQGAQGSFFFNIPMFSRSFVAAEDNNPKAFHDKQFISADTQPGSPNRDNVYVTWTKFDFTCGPQHADFCESPIVGSMSTNHGVTWSTPELVSTANPAICQFGGLFTGVAGDNSKCNFNQGSDNISLPNGDLEVLFNNGNTPSVDNQILGVHCHPTGSSPAGTAHLNCGVPAKVGNDIATGEPQCDFGRGPEQCIPGAFIRTNDFPRLLTTSKNGSDHLYAVWQDYRNQEFDVQLTQSLDGGLTWSPSVTINPDRGLDHYFAAIDIVKNGDDENKGDRLGVSYYRSERVPNENTTPASGFAPGQPGVAASSSDYVLAGGRALQVPYDFLVLSPPFGPPDGIQAGFNGDYSGLVINKGDLAHPIWSDTRNVDPFAPANGVTHDEDIFTDKVAVPAGRGRPQVGRIGRGGGGD